MWRAVYTSGEQLAADIITVSFDTVQCIMMCIAHLLTCTGLDLHRVAVDVANTPPRWEHDAPYHAGGRMRKNGFLLSCKNPVAMPLSQSCTHTI
jgi:hypothetical protein